MEELSRVTVPDYLVDLATREMQDIRDMRAECQQLESGTSYVRRMTQGRLDIVGGELARRRAGGAKGDLSELIGRLPDLLTDHNGTGGNGSSPRPPSAMEPAIGLTTELEDELESILSASELSSIVDFEIDHLAALVDNLDGFEHRVSNHRRSLHNTLDTLQGEITRRYKTGEASIDALLT
ncbi:MAG: hypothetical protein V3V01_10045 [Acidimicrobiales bacterium]